MQTRSKLILTALTAALVLGAAVSTASANRLEVSEQRFRVVWSGANQLIFVGLLGVNVTCPVTLEGSFHSKITSKVSGQLVGYISRAITTAASCGGAGQAYVLNGTEVLPEGATTTNTLPWHVRYDSFEGPLPNITGVKLQLIEAAFLLNVTVLGSTFSCLYKSTTASPAVGIVRREGGGVISGLRADETKSIPKFAGPGECPGSGRFRNTGTVSVLGSTQSITLTLVQ